MLRSVLTATLLFAGLLSLTLMVGGAGPQNPPPAETTVDTLDGWVETVAAEAAEQAEDPAIAARVHGQPGGWQFIAFGRPVLVLADADAGRMRVMSPVLDAQSLPVQPNEAQVRRVLQANFDTALDARYALRDGQLWSVFIHPLPTLTPSDFRGGVIQVLSLAHNFGTTYSSSGMRFGGGDEVDPDDGLEPEGPVQII